MSLKMTLEEIEYNLAKAIQSLCKAKGEQVETEEKMDASTADKYNLVNVPDNVLTPEQLKEKRKQLFLKSTTEARQRAKQKRIEEELEREKQMKMEEEKRLEKPDVIWRIYVLNTESFLREWSSENA